MTWTPIQIGNLAFFGPGKQTADIDFKKGVNVLCGASNTGKSFIVESIDYMLGGGDPLEDIPQRSGYDRGRISIKLQNGEFYTFERSVDGGGFEVFEGFWGRDPIDAKGEVLKAKHNKGKTDNISGWLLSRINLLGKQVRKNAKGVTQSLGFRGLARLVIVQEAEIIKRQSPFLTGQYTTKTSELSTLKLLLSGLDDSSYVSASKLTKINEGSNAKIELIEQWIEDLYKKFGDQSVKKQELQGQIEKIELSIETSQKKLEVIQDDVSQLINTRHRVFQKKETYEDRNDEIIDLLSRFKLLEQHYKTDIERLISIQESGSLFVHQEIVKCPLCGALPGDQHFDEDCDGDVEYIVKAAGVEIEKIERLLKELYRTIADLTSEKSGLLSDIKELEQAYYDVDKKIKESVSPTLSESRNSYAILIEKRSSVKELLDIFERIDHLENQKSDLIDAPIDDGPDEKPQQGLSKSVLNQLSRHVENLLKAWNFPEAERVYYDEDAADFVINGKPRRSHGKGFRAITHAAVTISLMEYCKERNLPHPGFVVLDSPLLSYWGPEGKEDDLKGTDLKNKFYEHLVKYHSENQVIIIENEHPQDELLDKVHFTNFTKNPKVGRYGFFPNQ